MSSGQNNDDISTASDFDKALEELLTTAAENEIDPEGSWEYKPDDTQTNWEVLIYELE